MTRPLSAPPLVVRRASSDGLGFVSQDGYLEPQAWHRHMGFEASGQLDGVNEGGVAEVFFRKVLAPPEDGV